MIRHSELRRKWVIRAEISAVEQICAELADWLAQQNLSEHRFALEILAREALNNAILHGCEQNPSLQVQCELDIRENELRLQITDEGTGFDWQSVLSRDIASVEQDHGRGLYLYHLYADSVEFNASGNSILLVRRRNFPIL